MTAHSPGPWRVVFVLGRGTDWESTEILDANGAVVIEGGADYEGQGWAHGETDMTEADARLIAAAPELLAALKEGLYEMNHPDEECPVCETARALIRRIEGEAGT
jgi:hypothetical protein